jgi:glycosyltransferase involved in cell wall biosynthesis
MIPASICFVAPMAYPVLAQDRSLPFAGGAEVQQVGIATALARRGHRVSMICHDHGWPDGESIRGVRVFRMCSPSEGVPVVRFLHPRLTSLWSAMGRANADVYYQRTSGAATGFVAAFARRHGRTSIFAGAHDADFDPALPLVHYRRDKLLYRWGVRNVSRIVAQTDRQQQRCKEVFGREAVRIDSCYAHAGLPAAHDGVILWVATVKPMKRPDLFLELARALPDHRFRLVGGPDGSAEGRAYFEQIRSSAAALPNVDVTGFVPFVDVERHFDGASIFVNTSAGEGFPNTFLQAWSRAIPTVSFFDAGATLAGKPVGFVVPDIAAMVAVVQRLKGSRALWSEAGERAQSCFEARHSADRIAEAYEQLIVDALATRNGSPARVPQPAKS